MKNENLERLGAAIKEYNERLLAFTAKAEAYRAEHTEEEYAAWHIDNAPPRVASGSDLLLMGYYERSGDNDELVIDRDMGAGAVPRLVESMQRAGLTSFVYAVTDRNAFDRLDDLCFEGCILDKTVQVRQWRHGMRMETTGIRMLLKR